MAKYPLGRVTDLPLSERFCWHCNRRLTGAHAWLELDSRDNSWHIEGVVPHEHSQGWFPIGIHCAAKLTAKEVG